MCLFARERGGVYSHPSSCSLESEIEGQRVVTLEGGACGRGFGQEGGALIMNGNSVLIKGTPESSLAPFFLVKTQQETQLSVSQEVNPGAWILDFPTSDLTSHPVYGMFVIAAGTASDNRSGLFKVRGDHSQGCG